MISTTDLPIYKHFKLEPIKIIILFCSKAVKQPVLEGQSLLHVGVIVN